MVIPGIPEPGPGPTLGPVGKGKPGPPLDWGGGP